MPVILQPPVSTFFPTILAPIAGVDWQYTVPNNNIFKLVNITCELDTDGNPADRYVNILITDGTNDVARYNNSNKIIANKVIRLNWGISLSSRQTADSSLQQEEIPPDMWLYPGWKIGTETTAIQATDQFDDIFIWVLQYLTPNVA